jgi:cephalosporin hydroxylase
VEEAAPRIIRDFHRLYYREARGWQQTWWLGTKALKCPLDLWVYQEIIFQTRPDLIVETGTAHGGSALYLASVFDLLGNGAVVTVDIEDREGRPQHGRITYLTGSSADPEVVEQVRAAAHGRRTMVVLDSDHSAGHVAAELAAYAPLVERGCYLIVEDTNVNGHPVRANHGPGPKEAVEDFLAGDDRFEVDDACQKHLLTMNPGGYLRRVR